MAGETGPRRYQVAVQTAGTEGSGKAGVSAPPGARYIGLREQCSSVAV